MIRLVSLVLLALALAPAATARAEPAAPLTPAEKQSLDAFAAANPACREWSDGCVACKRQDRAAYACSTPGIACQPTPFACRDPEPPATVPKGKP